MSLWPGWKPEPARPPGSRRRDTAQVEWENAPARGRRALPRRGLYMASKILVVDDEPDLELLVRQRFRREMREGVYEFLFARNGEEALAVVAAEPALEVVL